MGRITAAAGLDKSAAITLEDLKESLTPSDETKERLKRILLHAGIGAGAAGLGGAIGGAKGEKRWKTALRHGLIGAGAGAGIGTAREFIPTKSVLDKSSAADIEAQIEKIASITGLEKKAIWGQIAGFVTKRALPWLTKQTGAGSWLGGKATGLGQKLLGWGGDAMKYMGGASKKLGLGKGVSGWFGNQAGKMIGGAKGGGDMARNLGYGAIGALGMAAPMILGDSTGGGDQQGFNPQQMGMMGGMGYNPYMMGGGMTPYASYSDGMEKSAARTLGRLVAAETMAKAAADAKFARFAKTAAMLGKDAGLSDRDIEDMIKKAQVDWKKALGSAGGYAASGAGLGSLFGPAGMGIGALLGGGYGLVRGIFDRGGQQQGQYGGGPNSPMYSQAEQRMAARGGWNPQDWNQQMNFARDMGIGAQMRSSLGREFRNIANAGTGLWG